MTSNEIAIGKITRTIDELLATMSDRPWYSKVLITSAMLSQTTNLSLVRLPLILGVSSNTDTDMLNLVLKSIFNIERIYIGAGSKREIGLLFERETARAISNEGLPHSIALDLTVLPTCLLGTIRNHLLLCRRPNSHLATRNTEDTASVCCYGSTVCLIPADDMGIFDRTGIQFYLLPARSPATDPAFNTAELEEMRTLVTNIARDMELQVNEANLPPAHHVNPTVRKGYLALAAVAKLMDEMTGQKGFLPAIQEAWAEECRNVSVADSMKLQLFCVHLLHYIKSEQADYLGYFRKDRIARNLAAAEPALADMDEIRLGRTIVRLGIGDHKRHPFKTDDTGKPSHTWRSIVKFSASDQERLKRIAGEELMTAVSLSPNNKDEIASWLLKGFAGQSNLTPRGIFQEAGPMALTESSVFETLEDLVRTGKVAKTDEIHYTIPGTGTEAHI